LFAGSNISESGFEEFKNLQNSENSGSDKSGDGDLSPYEKL
jgi:hypothetical protein